MWNLDGASWARRESSVIAVEGLGPIRAALVASHNVIPGPRPASTHDVFLSGRGGLQILAGSDVIAHQSPPKHHAINTNVDTLPYYY